MAAAVYLIKRTRPFRPEAPKVYVRTNISETNMSFIDFIPGLIKLPLSGRITVELLEKEIEFHNFRIMIETANRWLRNNLDWEAVTCETMTLMHKSSVEHFDLYSTDTCFFDVSIQNKYYLKSLRVWIKRRTYTCDKRNVQVLNYVDVIPERLASGTMKVNFEKKEDVLRRVNEMIRNNAINGRVVTFETVAYEAATDWKIDTELTLTPISYKHLYIYRVFFDTSMRNEGEIGLEDFVPEMMSKGGIFSRPKFEPLSSIVKKSQKWLADTVPGRFISAKSFYAELKSNAEVDPTLMHYQIPGDFVKIYRVAYTKSRRKMSRSPIYLCSELCMPNDRRESMFEFGSRIADVYQKLCYDDISTYGNAANGLACCESFNVTCKNSIEEVKKESNKTLFRLRIEMKSGFYFFVVRLTYDVGFEKWKYIQYKD